MNLIWYLDGVDNTLPFFFFTRFNHFTLDVSYLLGNLRKFKEEIGMLYEIKNFVVEKQTNILINKTYLSIDVDI